jgi:hypothetical protein
MGIYRNDEGSKMKIKIAVLLSIAAFSLFLNSCGNSKASKVVLSEPENIKISN